MAAIDLDDLVEDLVTEINIPGVNAYPTVSNEEWVNYLRNAFWNAHLDGLMQGWTENEGLVSQLNNPNGSAMTRDQQQIIIIYAVLNIIQKNLLSMDTSSTYKAGSVEYSTGKSAQIYRALIDDMRTRLERILDRLAENGVARDIYYIDTYAARQYAISSGLISWIGSD